MLCRVTHSTVHSWHSSTAEATSEIFCNYNYVKMRSIKSLFNSRMALPSRMHCLAKYLTFAIVSIYWLVGTGNGAAIAEAVFWATYMLAGNLVTNAYWVNTPRGTHAYRKHTGELQETFAMWHQGVSQAQLCLHIGLKRLFPLSLCASLDLWLFLGGWRSPSGFLAKPNE